MLTRSVGVVTDGFQKVVPFQTLSGSSSLDSMRKSLRAVTFSFMNGLEQVLSIEVSISNFSHLGVYSLYTTQLL